MTFKIEITADTAIELGEKIAALAAQFGGTPAAAAEAEKPATRRRAKAEPDTAEPAEKPTLVADEGNASVAKEDAKPDPAVTETVIAPSEPTQEDKDALLVEATTFSQAHGPDALLAALKAVGAERFSAIPAAKYGDFRAEMDKKNAGASALS